MATLSFKNINKIYDNNVQAVFDFNLEAKDKEFIVFVGPSGCGKSTTLRMVAGLEDITSGQLFIDGLLVNNIVPKDRNIAMVFQSYALYPHMTVYDNMSFALKLRKVRMPLYEENAEADALVAKNKEILREINKINRQIRKKNDSEELFNKRDELYNQIFENEEKIKSLRVQKVGISELDIKETTDLIKRLENDLAKSKQRVVKYEALLEQYKAKLESEQDEEKQKALKENVELLENHIKFTKEGNEQTEKQIENNKEKLEYFRVNEVPLFELRKHNKYEINLEVYKTAKVLDLYKYLFRKPAALSGGQRQRVALGRAIVRHPKVFLMDEPLSNLDAKLRVQMRSEIAKIHKSVGTTTIYVTHDQTEAMTMADRIVIMKDGYIQQIGTPKEVYNNPQNMFVAGFIGSPSMNFLKGKYEKGHFVIDGEKPVTIKLSKKDSEILSNYEGQEVLMGARPENIYLKGDKNNANPTEPVKVNCDFAELLGYEYVLYTSINGQKLVLKASVAVEVNDGENIDICFNEDALYFFDKDSGKRI